MNILLLAPHPFYQERGTPIAVDLLLRVLAERGEQVDVLTYHEGEDRAYPGPGPCGCSASPHPPPAGTIRPAFDTSKKLAG
jgi:hypothetical protein